jgi:transcriptional regulator with PAS, ATPase and Fis domain
MYPIFIDGVLSGGLSVVTFVQDAYNFRTELENYERRTKQLLRRINKATGAGYTFDSIVAASAKSLEVKALALKMAGTDAAVLLQSESGTGKELYAQAIHNASGRKSGVFVAINCANFSADMLESELFGYEEGAFTGAKKGGKIGLFEAADQGTLFFDEISEMALPLQAKLLRALQEKRIRKVGGIAELTVDVRIIAACNADLEQYVRDGRFRKDLFYRLNIFPVRIPPLRERTEDIPAMTVVILEELSQKLKRRISITNDAMQVLERHDWPGNVRELRNVLEFSGYLAESSVIDVASLPNLTNANSADDAMTLGERVRVFEKAEISRLLHKYGDDMKGKQKTADILGISLSTLYNKLGDDKV